MYESFYGFTAKPFQLNADPEFYFGSSQHRRAMAFAEYGLHQSEGFIVVTGEVGAGKTTLVRSLLARLDPAQFVAAHLVSTHLDADDMLRTVAAAFGLRTQNVAKSELLLSIEALLAETARQGKRCLLIVDEAQNLTARAVEELRMLSNFQLETHALLQSFLVGQPEFRLILESPEMHQLRQRVIAACHIGPLDADETRQYVEHRLTRAGWSGVPPIGDEAFRAVHEASGGIPRRINLVCDRVLLSGFLADRREFEARTVREVAEELRGETQAPASLRARATRIADGTLAIPGPGGTRILDAGFPPGGALDGMPPEPSRQVERIEDTVRELHAAMLRIEHGNHAILGLFRRFLDRLQPAESDEETRQ